MATTTSKVREVLVALRDQLRLREGLADVNVFALPVKADDLGREYIVLATEITGEQSYPFTNATTKHETVSITGELSSVIPGAGDEVALDVMDRAMEILGEIEACLREDPRISDTAVLAELAEYTHATGVSEVGRVHVITFVIRAQMRLVSS